MGINAERPGAGFLRGRLRFSGPAQRAARPQETQARTQYSSTPDVPSLRQPVG